MGNLITPKRVQKLQMALHAKAKAEAGYRFYALYDKILALSIMRERYADFGPTPAFAGAGSWRRRSWQSITAARYHARPCAVG